MLETKNKQPSFEKINYSLRPAKNIERKMILEALHRLSFFEPIKNYMYIGFGSTFFTDFSLFHKQLGIQKLYSIELEEDYKERFEFNKPFHSINMIYGHSNEALKNKSIDWHMRKIIWLDYDYQITADVIIDIDTIVENSISGDAFLITLNASTKEVYSNPDASTNSKDRAFNKFKEQFLLQLSEDELIDYSSLVDSSIVPTDLAEWGLANVCTKIINKRIYNKIIERNELNENNPNYQNIHYKQVFDFHYQDGSMMMTIGFVFYDNHEKEKYERCNFDDFDFCKMEPFLIKAPNLTMKELQYIDSFLPSNLAGMDYKNIPDEEIKHYVDVYRYYPTFLEAFR